MDILKKEKMIECKRVKYNEKRAARWPGTAPPNTVY